MEKVDDFVIRCVLGMNEEAARVIFRGDEPPRAKRNWLGRLLAALHFRSRDEHRNAKARVSLGLLVLSFKSSLLSSRSKMRRVSSLS